MGFRSKPCVVCTYFDISVDLDVAQGLDAAAGFAIGWGFGAGGDFAAGWALPRAGALQWACTLLRFGICSGCICTG